MGGNYATEYAVAIVGIGGATTFLARAARRLLGPKEQMEKRIEALEEHKEHVDACLARDNERLQKLDEDSKLNLRMNLQRITHEIDGNHIEKMKELRDEAQEYLIKR